MSVASIPKELRPLVKLAKRQGWSTEHTRRGHLVFVGPRGVHRIVTGGTPSDRRAKKNLLADLRRCGLEVPR